MLEKNLPAPREGYLFAEKVPLAVDVKFYYPRPQSHYVGGDRGGELKAEFRMANYFMVKKPDIDNCVKFVLDSPMEKLVYKDDCAVVKLNVVKCYDDERNSVGRTEITVVPMYIDLANMDSESESEIDLTLDDSDYSSV